MAFFLGLGLRLGEAFRGESGGPPIDPGDSVLMESGDFLLLESGDKILLEA